MSKIIEYAKYYLSIGWSLIPVSGKDKIPPQAWKQYQTAQPTLDEVVAWIHRGWWLGLATGAFSGVVVVDDDRIKHGLNEWGFKSSVISQTISGGKHYYFSYSDGIRNTSNKEINVDVRGEGGYVVLPCLNGYEWVSQPTPDNLRQLVVLPDETKTLLFKEGEKKPPVTLTDSMGITKGGPGRHNVMISLANSLCNRYPVTDRAAVLEIMRGTNATYNPPMEDEQLREIFEDACRFVDSHPKETNPPEEKKVVVRSPRTLGDLVDLAKEMRGLEASAPSTGYLDLDEIIKGFIPGHLYTLTGETNVGKTSIACNFAFNLARQNRRCLYIALEPDLSVAGFFAALDKKKDFDALTDNDYGDIPGIGVLFQEDCPNMETLSAIIKTIEGYNLVVVDHIGYFVDSGDNYIAAQKNLIKQLALFAKHNKTALMIIAHPRKKTDGRLTMNDIAGTAAFKQDSTEVLILHRDKRNPDDPYDEALSDWGILSVAKKKVSTRTNKTYVKLYFSEFGPTISSDRNAVYEAIEPPQPVEQKKDNFAIINNTDWQSVADAGAEFNKYAN